MAPPAATSPSTHRPDASSASTPPPELTDDKPPTTAATISPPPKTLPRPNAPARPSEALAAQCNPLRLTDLQRVQRKWQMGSISHFLLAFKHLIPLRDISVDTYEDLSPSLLERAIAHPDTDAAACLALRDVIQALLLAMGKIKCDEKSSPDACGTADSGTAPSGAAGSSSGGSGGKGGKVGGSTGVRIDRDLLGKSWFPVLRVVVEQHRSSFADCFEGDDNRLAAYDDGITFLASTTWAVRMGLLLTLCDVAAEHADGIRAYIREAAICAESSGGTTAANGTSNANGSATGNKTKVGGTASGTANPARGSGKCELEARGIRLPPLGRCSRRRTFYMLGKARIYSGYRRKGTGTLLVECEDSKSMAQLVEALEGSQHGRDHMLAKRIRDQHLGPLLEAEEKQKRKMEKRRLEEIQREETRRRNAKRPRRKKAAYV